MGNISGTNDNAINESIETTENASKDDDEEIIDESHEEGEEEKDKEPTITKDEEKGSEDEEKLEELLKEKENEKDELALGDLNVEIAEQYIKIGNRRKAIICYKESCELFLKLNKDDQLVEVYEILGKLHIETEKLNTALQNYTKSLEIRKKGDDKSKQGEIEWKIGEIYKKMGEKEKSVGYFVDSYKNIPENEFLKREQTLLEIGHLYNDLGQSKVTLKYYVDALKIIKKNKLKTMDEGIVLSHVALVYKTKKDGTNALKFFNNSLKIFNEYGDMKYQSETLQYIAEIKEEEKKNDEAVELFVKAFEIVKTLNDKDEEREKLTKKIFQLYTDLGKTEEANKYK